MGCITSKLQRTDRAYEPQIMTPDWCKTSPQWNSLPGDSKNILLSRESTDPSADVHLDDVIENSREFPIKFPVESVRCHALQKLVNKHDLEKNINSTYPVIHEHALFLCAQFLNHQKSHGPDIYKNMNLAQLIDRFLSQRAAVFVGNQDSYLLVDKTRGYGNWESVGTPDEVVPLTLNNCLSYDEIKLAALLSVSSKTHFINVGDRYNGGKYEEERDKVEDGGIIVGLIGTRLTKKFVMEHREIVKTKTQNTQQYGYGASAPTLQGLFLHFYGDADATYDQLLPVMKNSPDRYLDLKDGRYFDEVLYARRITLSLDTLLLEANHRAMKESKKAFVHVVGLGLGVWRITGNQFKIYMDTFAERLKFLVDVLTNISDVCFAYIHHKMAGKNKDGDCVGHIKLHMLDRDPHDKLKGEDQGKLLVVSYAWDGNALPGNEFWLGSVDSSGDPAAACSTQVAELHNWHINPKVRAGNLMVATLRGLLTFQEYQDLHKDDWCD